MSLEFSKYGNIIFNIKITMNGFEKKIVDMCEITIIIQKIYMNIFVS